MRVFTKIYKIENLSIEATIEMHYDNNVILIVKIPAKDNKILPYFRFGCKFCGMLLDDNWGIPEYHDYNTLIINRQKLAPNEAVKELVDYINVQIENLKNNIKKKIENQNLFLERTSEILPIMKKLGWKLAK